MTDIDLHQLADRIRAEAIEGVHPSRGPLISVAALLTLIEGAAGVPVVSLAARRRRELWVVKGDPDTIVGTFFEQATAEQWRDRVREHQHPDAYIEHEPGDGSSENGRLPEPTWRAELERAELNEHIHRHVRVAIRDAIAGYDALARTRDDAVAGRQRAEAGERRAHQQAGDLRARLSSMPDELTVDRLRAELAETRRVGDDAVVAIEQYLVGTPRVSLTPDQVEYVLNRWVQAWRSVRGATPTEPPASGRSPSRDVVEVPRGRLTEWYGLLRKAVDATVSPLAGDLSAASGEVAYWRQQPAAPADNTAPPPAAPRADWSGAWAQLTGYVRAATEPIDPTDLDAYMVELKRKALRPFREWWEQLGVGQPVRDSQDGGA